MDRLRQELIGFGLTEDRAALLAAVGAVLVLLALMWVVNILAKRILLRWAKHQIEKSDTLHDDAFLKNRVVERLAQLVPAIVAYNLIPVALGEFPQAVDVARTMVMVWIAGLAIVILNGTINSLLEIYQDYEVSKRVPLKPVGQALKFLVVLVIGIAIFSMFIGKSPIVLFSGLGAMSAVLMLVFRDSILGLTAGVQLSMNHMVEVGDWIEMPEHGVDGDVLEVNLTSVAVQNWDKTISTIPAYDLISGSFKNWRGMSQSGGRRIKRAISIDVDSVRFCDDEMLERFKKVQLIQGYIEDKLKELKEHNAKHKIDESVEVNGRRLTNIGTFRAYIKAYLNRHPKIHQDMTLLVRHLPLTPQGIPIEIYMFSNDQRWAHYEDIAADIVDHLLAASKHFDLRVFSSPTGSDVRAAARYLSEAKH